MDGGSTDETVAIARQYGNKLTLISEPDRGQADAINKGWRRAPGDVLAWLNADDQYLPETVETAIRYFEAHPDASGSTARRSRSLKTGSHSLTAITATIGITKRC